jgi:hypothetical protein
VPDDATLEIRLRELLRDPRWSLRSRADAQARIRRAARRQRVRLASLTGATCAIAAVAVALPLTVLGGGAHSPQGTGPGGGISETAPAGVTSVPRYYVELGPVVVGSGGGPFKEATVVRTATGKVTATVGSPKPYVGFDFVAAAGNSGTFVLAAQQPFSAQRPDAFFRLSISPAGHAQLTPLSLAVVAYPGHLTGIALSPDGSQLALASDGIPPTTRGSLLQVANLANGTSRRWTWPNVGSEWDFESTQANLAWTNEQTLVFQMPVGHRPAGWPELSSAVLETRVLDTAAPGSNLAASRRVPGKASPSGGDADLTVAPGASLIMEFDRAQKFPALKGIDEVSTATGQTVRTLGAGRAIEAFWSNATGTKLIVLEDNAAAQPQLGIVTAKGTFTALPAPPGITAKDWQYLFTAW